MSGTNVVEAAAGGGGRRDGGGRSSEPCPHLRGGQERVGFPRKGRDPGYVRGRHAGPRENGVVVVSGHGLGLGGRVEVRIEGLRGIEDESPRGEVRVVSAVPSAAA